MDRFRKSWADYSWKLVNHVIYNGKKRSLNVLMEENVDESRSFAVCLFFFQEVSINRAISKGQVENTNTSGSLISHLTSNRSLCPPIDGMEDSQE